MHQHPGQSIASRIDALVRANSYKMLVNSHCYHLKWAEKKFYSDCHVNKSKHAKDRILASMISIRRNSYDYIEYVMGNKLEENVYFFFSPVLLRFTLRAFTVILSIVLMRPDSSHVAYTKTQNKSQTNNKQQ